MQVTVAFSTVSQKKALNNHFIQCFIKIQQVKPLFIYRAKNEENRRLPFAVWRFKFSTSIDETKLK